MAPNAAQRRRVQVSSTLLGEGVAEGPVRDETVAPATFQA